MVKYQGVTLTRGTLGPCEACTIAKAKQKNIPKHANSHVVAQEANKRRIFLDIASIKPNPQGWKSPNPNWRMSVDEHSTLKVSHFFPTKNAMVEPTCELLHKWKNNGKTVKYLCMDTNAGGNKILQQRAASKDWKLDLTCKFTARNTPQQNHTDELGLSDVSSKGWAVMIAAHVPLKERYLLYHKAFKYVTDTDGLRVIERNGKLRTRYDHFGIQNPPFATFLRTWDEAGTVTVKSIDLKGKLRGGG
jgi:hypothetical protein